MDTIFVNIGLLFVLVITFFASLMLGDFALQFCIEGFRWRATIDKMHIHKDMTILLFILSFTIAMMTAERLGILHISGLLLKILAE